MATKTCCTNTVDPCPYGQPDAQCVIYTGANLSCIGATTNETLESILEKINDKFCDVGVGLTFNNWISEDDGTVQFGGILVKNTSIDFDTFEVAVDNLQQDDTSPFLMGIDNNGNWRKIASTTFAGSTDGETLPSTVAENGLNYSFDLPSRQYTVRLGGPLIQDTDIDFDVFNLSLSNVPTGTPESFLVVDADGNILVTPFESILTFQNALTDTSNVVEWGGTLLHDTTIDQDGNDVVFDNGHVGFNLSSGTPTRTITIGNDFNGAPTFSIFADDGSSAILQPISGGVVTSLRGSLAVVLTPNFLSSGHIELNETQLLSYTNDLRMNMAFASAGNQIMGRIGLSSYVPGTSNQFYIKANDTGAGPDFRNCFMTFYSGDDTLSALMDSAGKWTFNALINLPVTANASPVDGDVWREDNTNTGVKIRVNGVTKTVTLS